MNRKLMPFMLLLIEVVMYYFICLYFHMDLDLIIGSGILYFLFLFIYGHYSLNTCLIWDEIKALVKSSFCFYIALLVLVPKSTGYERRMHLPSLAASYPVPITNVFLANCSLKAILIYLSASKQIINIEATMIVKCILLS